MVIYQVFRIYIKYKVAERFQITLIKGILKKLLTVQIKQLPYQ